MNDLVDNSVSRVTVTIILMCFAKVSPDELNPARHFRILLGYFDWLDSKSVEFKYSNPRQS